MERPSEPAYRQRIYARYKATHIQGSVAATPELFRYEAKVFEKTFGPLLPEDRGASIFEFGFGSGSFLHFLQGRGYACAAGMDADPAHALEARRLGVAGVEAGDALAYLATLSGALDCIVALDVVEHFKKDEVFRLLDAVRGALKPGGLFLWRSPNADGPFAGRIRYGDLTHELAFTRSSAWQLMGVAGFEDVRILPEPPVATGVRSLLRVLLWKVFAPLARLYLFAESYAQDALLTANLIVVARRPRSG